MFNLSGDAAQIGFLSIPLSLLGMIAGAGIGYGWESSPPATDADDRSPTAQPST